MTLIRLISIFQQDFLCFMMIIDIERSVFRKRNISSVFQLQIGWSCLHKMVCSLLINLCRPVTLYSIYFCFECSIQCYFWVFNLLFHSIWFQRVKEFTVGVGLLNLIFFIIFQFFEDVLMMYSYLSHEFLSIVGYKGCLLLYKAVHFYYGEIGLIMVEHFF
jgi:hypothetical protein